MNERLLSVDAATVWARQKANDTGRTQYVVRSFTDASEKLRLVSTVEPGDTIASMVPGRLAELIDGMVGK